MRMTNKIMQNNSLYNVNNNKILQDQLSTSMSTQKKIVRPSDDPVVAIRALRLRTSVAEIAQYYTKNVPDAESWLDVTSDALSTTTDVITDALKQVTKAANKDLTSADLAVITEQLKSLSEEFYATGNEDYAGRYVFTGYRTNTALSFTEEVETKDLSYEITEQIAIGDFDTINYTDLGELKGLDANNYNDAAKAAVTEQDISNGDIHRLRLSYDKTSDTIPTITDKNGTNLLTLDNDADGTRETTIAPTRVSTTESPDPYQQILAANTSDPATAIAIYVPETGEMLFSDKAFEAVNGQVTSADEIRVTYIKDSWQSGDVRPEHYFACTATDSTNVTPPAVATTKKYNEEYLTTGKTRQNIEYNVGYNQTIQVNTTADEVFNHDLGRDIDDIENSLSSLVDLEASITDLKSLLKNATEGTAEYTQIQTQLDSANKAYTYVRDNVNNIFKGTITNMQSYLDEANLAITNNGTRSKRLDLVEKRLMSQKSTFETLQSNNEDADISEVAIKLTSAELTYEAALMATGKIMQTSLMNYI